MLVSSADMVGFNKSNKFDAFFRSFTYSKNISGFSIEPCKTLHVIVSSSVIWMNCFLFDK